MPVCPRQASDEEREKSRSGAAANYYRHEDSQDCPPGVGFMRACQANAIQDNADQPRQAILRKQG